jgi:exopolysaccharide transport family protein
MRTENSALLVPPSSGPVAERENDYYYGVVLERGSHLKNILQVLVKRWRWVIGVLLGALCLTGLVILLMTPVYKATTVLQITQDNPGGQINDNEALTILKGGQDISKFQETQYKILTSRGVAARVIEALRLQDTPEFKAVRDKDPSAPPEKLKSDMIDLFLQKLVVNPVKDTYLVEVSFKSADQELAQKVTEVLGREYMQLAIDSRNQSFTLVKEWLENQLSQMAQKVQLSQKKLFEFGQKHDFFALEDKDNVILQKYLELSALLTKAQSERLAKEAQYRQIKEQGPDAPLITNNPLIMNLRQELVNQTAKVSGLNRTLLPGHPELQVEKAKLGEIQGRLQGEVKRLQESIRADYEAAVKAENLLTKAFNEQKDKLAHLQNHLVDFHILKRDAQTTEKLYQALLTRMGEATVASTMVPSNVAVIDPAERPYTPYLPRPLLFLALSVVLGLFLGMGMAFLVDYLDNSLRSPEDVENLVQLPSLGVIPLVSSGRLPPPEESGLITSWKLKGLLTWGYHQRCREQSPAEEKVILLQQPRSGAAEAFRHLRTSLMLSTAGDPPRVVVVTSPYPGEGKSTIAVNLAVALAQDGRRVVLLDGDLRKPHLHKILQVEESPGLTNYLAGQAARAAIIKPTGVEQLSLIPAGPLAPAPTELLNSRRFKTLVQELREEFQHLIIDTPPTLGFADARVLAVQADGVLLVAKQDSTSWEAGRQVRQLLQQINAKILGMVLNQAKPEILGKYNHFDQNYYDRYYGSQKEGQEGNPQDDSHFLAGH